MPTKARFPRSLDCSDCQERSARPFCDFSSDALPQYQSLGSIVMFPARKTLFRQGDAAKQIFVLCSGHVKLACSSEDGRNMNLKIAKAGDLLGLDAVVTGLPYEVSAEVMQTSWAKVVRAEEFLAFLKAQGEASLHAAQSLASEYRAAFTTSRRIALSGSIAARIANLLLEWSTGCDKHNTHFTMSLSHGEIADFVSTTRETVSRTLGKMQRDALIEIRGSVVYVLNTEGLLRLATGS